MSNPQGPGKQGRKDAKAKASQPHQAAAPGRSEHLGSGQSTRPAHEQGHMQNRSHPSHPSASRSAQSHEREETLDEE
jgi:hypothetical protein